MSHLYHYGIIPSTLKYTNSAMASGYHSGNVCRMANNLKKYRQMAGLTREQLAKLVNTTSTTIYRKETGDRGLRADELPVYARALGCDPKDLIQDREHRIPVLGSIGAGEMVLPIDDLPISKGFSDSDTQEMNCEFVEAPPGASGSDMAALKVIGDSMEPFLYEGDIVYYNQIITSGLKSYTGKRVIIKLRDGRAFIKVLRQGFDQGKYTLQSINTPKLIENVEIEWAAKVAFIKPKD